MKHKLLVLFTKSFLKVADFCFLFSCCHIVVRSKHYTGFFSFQSGKSISCETFYSSEVPLKMCVDANHTNVHQGEFFRNTVFYFLSLTSKERKGCVTLFLEVF